LQQGEVEVIPMEMLEIKEIIGELEGNQLELIFLRINERGVNI